MEISLGAKQFGTTPNSKHSFNEFRLRASYKPIESILLFRFYIGRI